jgi:hypothetical protein
MGIAGTEIWWRKQYRHFYYQKFLSLQNDSFLFSWKELEYFKFISVAAIFLFVSKWNF